MLGWNRGECRDELDALIGQQQRVRCQQRAVNRRQAAGDRDRAGRRPGSGRPPGRQAGARELLGHARQEDDLAARETRDVRPAPSVPPLKSAVVVSVIPIAGETAGGTEVTNSRSTQ